MMTTMVVGFSMMATIVVMMSRTETRSKFGRWHSEHHNNVMLDPFSQSTESHMSDCPGSLNSLDLTTT